MKTCRKCGKEYSEEHYGKYPSGTLLPDCRECVRVYQRKRRLKRKARPIGTPDYTGMRHPDPDKMKEIVDKTVERYALEMKAMEEAGIEII